MDVLKKTPVREQDPKVRATNFEEVCLGYNREEAMEEASRCINCKNAQCIKGCPVSINIPGFIEKVKNGDDLKKLLTYYKAGSTVTMTVQSLENGKYVERNVQITLGSKSDMPQSQDSQNESRSESQASPQRKLGR